MATETARQRPNARGPSRPFRLAVAIACGALLAAAFAGSAALDAASGGLVIHEILAADTAASPDGDAPDWLEIANRGTAAVDLEGYSLTDDPESPQRSYFPPGAVIAAGGYVVVFAVGSDAAAPPPSPEPPALRVGFRLDADGETLALFDRAGALLDRVEFPDQVAGWSWGRHASGDEWRFYALPSPGAANGDAGLAERPSEEPAFDPPAGISYEPGLRVSIAASPSFLDLRYTTDGSDPTAASALYVDPIEVASPRVIKARAFSGERALGRIATATYLVAGRHHEIDVLSISTAPANLHDADSGILTHPERRGEAWERPATIELFAAGGERRFAAGTGIRVHGNSARLLPKKSFRFHFRRRYGEARLEHALFDDPQAAASFDSLVARGGTNDTWVLGCADFDDPTANDPACASYVRDTVVSGLFRDMGNAAVHSRPVALYLNGEYVGLYALGERIDEDFARAYIDGAADWDVISNEGEATEATDGDIEEWSRFAELLRNADPARDEDIAAIERAIDLDNFFDYVVLTIWSRNWDWLGNVRAARERSAAGRWRFFVWDAENALLEGGFQHAEDTFGSLESDRGVVGRIFAALLSRPEFAARLRDELLLGLDGIFAADRMEPRIRSASDAIAAEIPHEADLWPAGDVETWRRAIDDVVEFAAWRGDFLARTLSGRLPPLDRDAPPPPALPAGARVCILHAGDAPGDSERTVAARLAAGGAAVELVPAAGADPASLARRFHLALAAAGARPPAFDEGYIGSGLPLVFWESDLIQRALPLARLRGVMRFDALSLPGRQALGAPALPSWTLKAFDEARDADVLLEPLGEGVVPVAVPARPDPRDSGRRAVVLAGAGARCVDGRIVDARAAYFAMDDFRSLDGYGVEIFDRVVAWAIEGAGPLDAEFIRGDADGDGAISITDALRILGYLFIGEAPPGCADAFDANDDGAVDIADAIAAVRHALTGASLPAPFPAAGTDPTADPLDCPAFESGARP